MTDEIGALTLARNYKPYVDTMSSAGDGGSSYGFTGEWMDVTGLVYLRARYYSPWQGRFMTRDSWAGDYNSPMSYNPWLYGYANPVNLTDPTGRWPNLPPYLPPAQPGCHPHSPPGECIPMCDTEPDTPLDSFIEWGADKVYETYLALRDTPGWWNKNRAGTMTPHDMLEWLLAMEFCDNAATLVSSEMQKETAVRNFYSICSYRGGWCNSRSPKDMIEYITAKRLANQSGRHLLVPKGENPNSYWVDHRERWSTVDLSSAFYNPGVWISGHGDFRVPMDWGNISMFGPKTIEASNLIITNEGTGIETKGFTFALSGGDPFVILNFCQDLYWHSDPLLEKAYYKNICEINQ